MNHPLRYKGYTFYQASFANNDLTSIFQVVKIQVGHFIHKCIIINGLRDDLAILHALFKIFKKKKKLMNKLIFFFALSDNVFSHDDSKNEIPEFDTIGFSQLPVQYGGKIATLG